MSKTGFDFIRYANCWEDPLNLFRSLDIAGREGVSVLSAGDNTLAMLTKDPARIVAIDINPTQIYLFELKRAGFRSLSYPDLLSLLGVYETGRSYELFLSLKDSMEPEAYRYFEGRRELFDKGVVNIGKFENYFRLFRRYVIPLISTRRRFEKLAAFSDVDAQAGYYMKVINNRRMRAIFNVYFGFRMMGRLGRDKSFYRYVDDKEDSARNIKQIVDYGLTHVPGYDNPYVNYICAGGFFERCLPEYLKEENYPVIRERLDRVETRLGELSDIDGSFAFFNLSDIFEYMSEEEFESSISRIADLSSDGAAVAYYNMQNKRYITDGRFELDKELSERCTAENRAFFYRDFLVYRKRRADEQGI